MPKFCPKGVADITGVQVGGHSLYIEVKKPGTYQSKDQKKFQENVEAYGGTYIVARSVGDVETFFREGL